MPTLDLALAALGGALLLLSLLSNTADRRAFVSEPLAAFIFGILIGPRILGLLDPTAWGEEMLILEQAARVTLAIGLMGVALRLPPGYIGKHWRSMALLLGVAMPVAAVVSGGLVYLCLGLAVWPALLIGAILTPTDPIIASSIVTGPVAERYLPVRLRHLISAESGVNDGLAYPLVLLPLLMIESSSVGDALVHWGLLVVLWETLGAAVVGAMMGYAAGRLLRWAQDTGSINHTSYLGYTVILSLFLLGFARLIGTDGILAVFVGGLAYDSVVVSEGREIGQAVQEAVNRFFTMPIFMIFGMALPWAGWAGLGWPALGLVAGLLLLRRMPIVLALGPWIRSLRRPADAEFVGWFGPMGVAAMFYAAYASRQLGNRQTWVIASLAVAGSIVVHGASATLRSRLYGKHVRDPVLTQQRNE